MNTENNAEKQFEPSPENILAALEPFRSEVIAAQQQLPDGIRAAALTEDSQNIGYLEDGRLAYVERLSGGSEDETHFLMSFADPRVPEFTDTRHIVMSRQYMPVEDKSRVNVVISEQAVRNATAQPGEDIEWVLAQTNGMYGYDRANSPLAPYFIGKPAPNSKKAMLITPAVILKAQVRNEAPQPIPEVPAPAEPLNRETLITNLVVQPDETAPIWDDRADSRPDLVQTSRFQRFIGRVIHRQ